MAIDLPTTRQNLNPMSFQRLLPLLAGDSTADKPRGFRGISSETNHAYAYKVGTLVARSTHDDRVLLTTTSASFATVITAFTCELGADVSTLKLAIDCKDAEIRIITDNDASTSSGTSGSSGSTRQLLTDTATMSDQTGIAVEVQIQMKKIGGPSAKLYSFSVREVALTTGDMP